MGKTNPIGVRFDEEMLKDLKEGHGITSPQKALNFLTDYFYATPEKKEQEEEKEEIPPPDDNSEIEKQIAAIEAERIPKERDTPLGRYSWQRDQRNRINELQQKLK